MPAGLRGTVTAAADLFDAATAVMIARRLVRVLAAVAADPAIPLHRVEVLDEAERRQVLPEWNDTAAAVPTRRRWRSWCWRGRRSARTRWRWRAGMRA